MEARQALREGAREIDMVINVGLLKEGDYEAVRQDISRVADACREVGGCLQGHHRGRSADRRRKGHRLQTGKRSQGRLCEDLYRIRRRGCHRVRRRADAGDCRTVDGSQGLGRHQDPPTMQSR